MVGVYIYGYSFRVLIFAASSGTSVSNTSRTQGQGSTSRLGEEYSYLVILREQEEAMNL